MNRKEKNTIRKLPPKYRPIGAWGYLGYTILFGIPVIGWICLIVFALSGSNINRRSFARSYFAGALVIAIIIAIVFAIIYFAMPQIVDQIKAYGIQLWEYIMGLIGQGKGGDNPEESLALIQAMLKL